MKPRLRRPGGAALKSWIHPSALVGLPCGDENVKSLSDGLQPNSDGLQPTTQRNVVR